MDFTRVTIELLRCKPGNYRWVPLHSQLDTLRIGSTISLVNVYKTSIWIVQNKYSNCSQTTIWIMIDRQSILEYDQKCGSESNSHMQELPNLRIALKSNADFAKYVYIHNHVLVSKYHELLIRILGGVLLLLVSDICVYTIYPSIRTCRNESTERIRTHKLPHRWKRKSTIYMCVGRLTRS